MNRLRRHRTGFSLIELLIVIAIICVLAGLIIPAMTGVIISSRDARTQLEIAQMSVAIDKFKERLQVRDMPSTVRLGGDTDPVLRQIWPRIKDRGINWGVTGTLTGDQCLVFFLRGPRGTGFSTNPDDPSLNTGDRIGPFYAFDRDRLVKVPANSVDFPSYLDPFGTPYAFFSAGNQDKGYITDCPNVFPGGPYWDTDTPTRRFHNARTFQIISAGRDGQFGPGGQWNSGAGAANSPAMGTGNNAVGRDNLTNFWGKRLGIGD